MGLRLQGIEKIYTDFRLELDFEVRRGELFILLGPSGCGKTTTLRLIAGFIDPGCGTLHMDDRRIDGLPAHLRRIGVVFQDYALFPHLDVRDNIGFGLRMQGWRRGEARTRIEELLDLVSLQAYGNRKVTRLSGGEQQRVALARALAPRPGLLLLDEPLSALDAKLRRGLRTEIRRIQRELALTTLYVTHDQEEALALGDRIAVMRDGHIEQIDTPENVYNRPRNLFVGTFLGQANLLRGRLRGRESGPEGASALVDTAIGRFRARWPAEEQLLIGQEVVVFFRPEHCRWIENTAAGRSAATAASKRGGQARSGRANRISGRVVRREYLGSHQLVEVQAGDERLTLDLAQAQIPAAGGSVRFSLDARKISLFPAVKS